MTFNIEDEKPQPKPESEQYKDMAEVAQKSGSNKNGIAAVAVIAMIAIGVVLYLGNDKPDEMLTKSDQSDVFGTGAAPELPNRRRPPPMPIEAPQQRQTPMYIPAKGQSEDDREAKRLRDARRRSSMIVYVNNREDQKAVPQAPPQMMKASTDPFSAMAQFPFAQQQKTGTADERFLDRATNPGGMPVAAAFRRHNLEKTILPGKILYGVLDTAINSDLPGMARAIISADYYGAQGRNVLIPAGSMVIARPNSTVRLGQRRIFLAWDWLMRPDGYEIPLQASGSDRLGRAGVGAIVDTRFWERTGAAILMSIIAAGVSNIGVDSGDQFNSADAYRQGISQALQRESQKSLQEYGNVDPTLNVHQGTVISILVNRVLPIEPYVGSGYGN